MTEAGLVHVDARVLALHLLGDPRFTGLTRVFFAGLKSGEYRAQTSAIGLYQLLAEPYRRADGATAERARRLLETIPGLAVFDVTPAVAAQAAIVQAQLGGRTERALHVATAFLAEADVFLTDRSTLRRIAGMAVETLESFLD